MSDCKGPVFETRQNALECRAIVEKELEQPVEIIPHRFKTPPQNNSYWPSLGPNPFPPKDTYMGYELQPVLSCHDGAEFTFLFGNVTNAKICCGELERITGRTCSITLKSRWIFPPAAKVELAAPDLLENSDESPCAEPLPAN